MTAVPNRALAEAERKLTLLLMEVRGTATFEQVKLYVARFTNGRLLSEYLHDDSIAQKERATLATVLIDILLTKDYSRLPPLENAAPPNPLPAVPPTTTPPTPPTADRGAQSPAEPHASSAASRADADDDATPAPDEIRAMIRSEVRRELANIFDIAAKVLRETK